MRYDDPLQHDGDFTSDPSLRAEGPVSQSEEDDNFGHADDQTYEPTDQLMEDQPDFELGTAEQEGDRDSESTSNDLQDIEQLLATLTQLLQNNLEPSNDTSSVRSPEPSFSGSKIVRSEYFTGAAKVIKKGLTFLEKFSQVDPEASAARQVNKYHPFASFEHWEFTNILFRMPCSLSWKSELLNTRLVSLIQLTYTRVYLFQCRFARYHLSIELPKQLLN